MTIFINQNSRIVAEKSTLYDVLNQQNFSDKSGVAVALNDQVITSSEWKTTALDNRDKIAIITASQGG